MPTRAKREPLSRERLLAAAVAIADSEGVPAVTMRRVSAAVGVEAMSLYHHLPGKEALLDGLVDSVVAEALVEIHAVEEAGGAVAWDAALRRRFLTARTVMLRHPWAPMLIGTRTSIPPSAFGIYEAIVATMVEGGFSYHLAHRALHSFGSMPLGFVQELFNPASGDDATTEEEFAAMAAILPHLTAMMASEIDIHDGDTLGWCDSQDEFEFTLDLLLDGFARQLES